MLLAVIIDSCPSNLSSVWGSWGGANATKSLSGKAEESSYGANFLKICGYVYAVHTKIPTAFAVLLKGPHFQKYKWYYTENLTGKPD